MISYIVYLQGMLWGVQNQIICQYLFWVTLWVFHFYSNILLTIFWTHQLSEVLLYHELYMFMKLFLVLCNQVRSWSFSSSTQSILTLSFLSSSSNTIQIKSSLDANSYLLRELTIFHRIFSLTSVFIFTFKRLLIFNLLYS